MMHPFLAELRSDLIAYDESRPRSQQTELGASDTYECRARALLKLLAVPPSEEKMSWPANVGSAIDGHVGTARCHVNPARLAQLKVSYRGVKCTVDEYDPPTTTLTDWKSKEDRGAIADVEKDGPDPSNVGQVMIGAAALREAGYPVTRVRLCYLTRDGDLEDGYVWEADFDQAQADAAADWHAEQVAEAAPWKDGLAAGGRTPEPMDLVDLRDKPRWWCAEFCEHLSNCRGEDTGLDPADPETEDLGRRFLEAKDAQESADDRRKYYRNLLAPLRGPLVIDGRRLNWSGGTEKPVTKVDVDEMESQFRLFLGEPPMKTTTTVTARSLRVTKAAPKKGAKS